MRIARRVTLRALAAVLAVAAALFAVLGAGQGTQYSGLTTLTLRQGEAGYDGWGDTYMSATPADSNKNYGGSTTLLLGRSAFFEYVMAFVANISDVPDSSMIAQVRAFFFVDTLLYAGALAPKCRTYRCMNDLVVGTANGANQIGSCDWNDYGAGQWYTAGGKGRGTANGPEAQRYASFAVITPGADTTAYPTRWWGIDTDTTLDYDTPYIEASTFVTKSGAQPFKKKGWFSVELQHQTWLYHKGANDNLGFLIFANEEARADTCVAKIRSADWPEIQYRPYLEITYYDPDTITVVHDTLTVGTTAKYLGIGNGIGRQ